MRAMPNGVLRPDFHLGTRRTNTSLVYKLYDKTVNQILENNV